MALGRHNLARLAERTLERLGGGGILRFEDEKATAGRLHERTRRLGRGLVDLGIKPGDRVVVFMSNRLEVGIIYGALWRAGAVITPAIFLLPPPDLRHILEDAEATAVVTTPEFLPNVRIAAEGVPSIRWILLAGDSAPQTVALADLESVPPGDIVPREDDDLAAVMYTGGTTGRAKGVMLTHDNLWSAGRSGHQASTVPGVNRTLVPLPLSHSYGLIVTVVGLHAEEPGEAVLLRWFEPEAFLRAIQDHKLQRATAVPSMLQILLDSPLEDYDLSSLRYITSGAAPLAREVAEAFEKRVPGVEIDEAYGLTENAAVLAINSPGARRLGSVGKVVPGAELRIEGEDGTAVAAGEPGEICFRGPGVMQGYWRSPEETESALAGGWLHTGDIGRVDEDGYLYVVDRKKDLIIRGGFNVFPRDVEDVLVEHPAVAMAAVVGRPDTRRGEEVVAYVSLHPGHQVEPAEIVAFAKERLGRHKYPREVHVVPMIPVTPVGKIDRKALRARAAEKAASK
jgi:long-chain acyl-CoA synthetase